MAIIVEGFDNSGKSTLAKAFDLDVEHPGPAPKNYKEEGICLDNQLRLARLPLVLDRVTCVSSQVYRSRLFEPKLLNTLNDMIKTPHCILIYCRPTLDRIMDFKNHEAKEYDNPKDIKWLEKNSLRLVSQYDQLMATIPHMKYDWENPDYRVIEESFNAQFTIGVWRICLEKMKTLSQA